LHTIPLKLIYRKKERKKEKEFTEFPALSRLMGMR
jgi:hypothetical protein